MKLSIPYSDMVILSRDARILLQDLKEKVENDWMDENGDDYMANKPVSEQLAIRSGYIKALEIGMDSIVKMRFYKESPEEEYNVWMGLGMIRDRMLYCGVLGDTPAKENEWWSIRNRKGRDGWKQIELSSLESAIQRLSDISDFLNRPDFRDVLRDATSAK